MKHRKQKRNSSSSSSSIKTIVRLSLFLRPTEAPEEGTCIPGNRVDEDRMRWRCYLGKKNFFAAIDNEVAALILPYEWFPSQVPAT
jgi:hypothetical protein